MIRDEMRNPPFAVNRRDTAELDIAVALIPITVWAIFIFSWRALVPVSVGVLTCVLLDILICFLIYKRMPDSILSSAVTGILVGLSVSVYAPVWAVIVGGAASILVAKYSLVIFVKHPPIFSPAALGMLVASLLSFETEPFIESFRGGEMPSERLIDLLIGNIYGALGKVSLLLAALAGIYLILRRAISLRVFASALITFIALSLAFYPEWTTYTDNMIYQLVCGGFVFCLTFAACDRRGAPVTSLGKIVYGAAFALLAFVVRCYTEISQPELVSAVVTGLTSKMLDTLFKGQPFGGKR